METNRIFFDPLIKNDMYAFLRFIPTQGSPKKFRMNASVYGEDRILIEERDFVLELDTKKKSYQEHYVGLQQDGKKQRVMFSAWDINTNVPLKRIKIHVEVVKIKDGDNDGRGGVYLKPKRPNVPVLIV